MALVPMFLCNQSYASHGRDFLLWATILNSSVVVVIVVGVVVVVVVVVVARTLGLGPLQC